MKTRALLLLAVLLALPSATAPRGRSIDMAEFGRVELLPSAAEPRGLAIAFSDRDGPGPLDRRAIEALQDAGFAVALIDSRQVLGRLDKSDAARACIDLPGPLEWLSSTAERDLAWDRYRSPLLLGHGTGAGFVDAALAQAPQAFAGGIGVDAERGLPLRRPFCGSGARASAATVTPAAKGGPLPALYLRTAERLLAASGRSSSTEVVDLPLVEVSATARADTLAIIYSGDGGWRDIDKQVGEDLAAHGLAVIGVDCLRYFWSALTPEQVSADLARILAHYQSAWRVRRVVLIGYSFGADILPFAYNLLPADLRADVSQISLIAPGRAADFEIQPLGWFGAGPSDDAQPIAPEAARLKPAKVQCIFGRKDADDSLCTDASAGGMEIISHAGGHHFDGDYHALTNDVLTGLWRRSNAHHAPAASSDRV